MISHDFQVNREKTLIISLQSLRPLLLKSPHERSPSEIATLAKLSESFPFFTKISSKSPALAHKLIRKLRFREVSKGKALFFAGDAPDNFYLILFGSVFVLLPKDKDRLKREKTAETEKLKAFLSKNSQSPLRKSSTAREFSKKLLLFREKPLFPQEIACKAEISKENGEKSANFQEFSLWDLQNAGKFFEDGVFRYDCASFLWPGQSFGELGLLIRKPRNATILCREDCGFLFLEKADFLELETLKREKINRKIEFFSKFCFKEQANREFVAKKMYLFEKKRYFYGKSLFSEGNPVDGCFLVAKGSVLLRKNAKNHRKFRELAVMGNGAFVGEDHVLKEISLRNYAAVSNSAKTVAFFVEKQLFLQILKENPALYQIFSRLSQEKHAFLTEKAEILENSPKTSQFLAKSTEMYVRTEENDLNQRFFPRDFLENSSKTRLLLRKSCGFSRNAGFLRGKTGVSGDCLEINVQKSQTQRILDIFAKNEASSAKNSRKTLDFASFFAVSQPKARVSMIRSPLNKYSFVRIDEKSRKVEEIPTKPTEIRGKTDKNATISQLHRRIQSAVPFFARNPSVSSKNVEKTEKKGGNRTKTASSLANLKEMLGGSKGNCEKIEKIKGNSEEIAKNTRRNRSAIYKTKHNMFFFIKKP